jgi:Ni/Co efflux regulator RcnB
MKATAILFATAFAFASASAFAADAAKDEYKAAKKQADATYKQDKAACKSMKGDEKKSCEKEAKAKHKQALADAKGMKKGDKSSSGTSTNMAPSSQTSAPATTK